MIRWYKITILAVMAVASITPGQLKEKAEKIHSLFERTDLTRKNSFNPEINKLTSASVLDSSLAQDWLFGEWQNTQSSVFSYSPDLKDEVSIFRTYDYDKWNPKIRTTRKYDDSRNLLWECVEMYKDNKWEFVQQKFVTYENGLVMEELFQSWNNDSWINYTRFTSKYDIKGNQTELLTETWVADQWFNTSRYTTEYDENNNDTLIVAESWNQGWKFQYKNERTFDDYNQLTVNDYFQWENEDWKPIDRTTNIYNSENELMETLQEQWIDKILVNSITSLFFYDENGNKTTEIFKRWNFTDNKWANNNRYTYEYNNGKPAGLVLENWIEDKWVNVYKTIIDDQGDQFTTYSLAWSDSQWVNSARYINFYKKVTSVNEPEHPVIFKLEQNYPNPFNPSTTISYTISETQHVSLKIFNVLGQVVKTLLNENVSAGTHNIQFNASGLPSGVYYYRIESPGLSETKSMILLK